MYRTYHGHVAVGGFAGCLLALLLEPLLLLLVLLRGVLLLVKVVAVVVLSLSKYFLLTTNIFYLTTNIFLSITFTVTPSAARWSPGYCSSGTAGEIVEASKLCRGTNIFTSSSKYFPV